MKEELTKEMHSEFRVSKEDEVRLIAGSTWQILGMNPTEEEIEEVLKFSLITKEQLMKYKDYWSKYL